MATHSINKEKSLTGFGYREKVGSVKFLENNLNSYDLNSNSQLFKLFKSSI